MITRISTFILLMTTAAQARGGGYTSNVDWDAARRAHENSENSFGVFIAFLLIVFVVGVLNALRD